MAHEICAVTVDFYHKATNLVLSKTYTFVSEDEAMNFANDVSRWRDVRNVSPIKYTPVYSAFGAVNSLLFEINRED